MSEAMSQAKATKAGCPCRICGRELPPEHPASDLIGWPQPLLPGDVPSLDEMCAPCQQKLLRAHGPNGRRTIFTGGPVGWIDGGPIDEKPSPAQDRES